jgi:O-Antigen ligase
LGDRLPGWRAGLTGRTSAVIGSVAVGCFMQGGFYAAGRAGVLALVLCAAVLTTWRGSWDVTDRRLILTSVVLIVWAGLNGVVRGSWLDAVPASATVVAFSLMFLVARRLSGAERRMAVVGVVAVGAVVAVAGLWGVGMHRGPWAAPEGQVWRSLAGTTYWNATAAILVMLAVVALAWCARDPAASAPAVAGAVLLAGAAATLSRGGALAALAGIICLGILGGIGASRAWVPPLVGAGLIMLGLVPSIPVTSAPNPGAALLGLGVGLTVTVLLSRRMPTVSLRWIVLGVAAGAVALGALILPVLASRVTVASPRWSTWDAALRIVAEHPLIGVGPGRLVLVWRDAAGVTHGTTLVHNEWLQLLGELGAVGAGLVLVMAVVVMRPVVHGLHGPQPVFARAGFAAAAVFVIASTFDFLWHLIAIPVLLAMILGCAVPSTTQPSNPQVLDRALIPVPEHDPSPHPTERSR